LPTRATYPSYADRVVGRGYNALTKTDVADKTQVPVRLTQDCALVFEKQLKDREHVSSHFPAMLAPSFPSVFQFTCVRIGSLRNTQNTGPHAISGPVNNEIWTDRQRNPSTRSASNRGGVESDNFRIPSAFSLRSNISIASQQRFGFVASLWALVDVQGFAG
jgi:hypothetical protein